MIETILTSMNYYVIVLFLILLFSLVKLIKKGSDSDFNEKEDEFCGKVADKKSTSSEKATPISLVR